MTSSLLAELIALLGATNVLHRRDDLILYEYDGSVEKALPDVVVFPTTTQHVAEIVKLAIKHQVPIVGRGAGTGLSGGVGTYRRSDDRLRADESHFGGRHTEPAGGAAARSGERGHNPRR